MQGFAQYDVNIDPSVIDSGSFDFAAQDAGSFVPSATEFNFGAATYAPTDLGGSLDFTRYSDFASYSDFTNYTGGGIDTPIDLAGSVGTSGYNAGGWANFGLNLFKAGSQVGLAFLSQALSPSQAHASQPAGAGAGVASQQGVNAVHSGATPPGVLSQLTTSLNSQPLLWLAGAALLFVVVSRGKGKK